VRDDFIAGLNGSSFGDGVVTVDGEGDGLVELEKNGFNRFRCIPRGVHRLEIFLELSRLDCTVFGPEVRQQVKARDVAELKHGMREGAHVDAGNRIEKLLAEGVVNSDIKVVNVSVALVRRLNFW